MNCLECHVSYEPSCEDCECQFEVETFKHTSGAGTPVTPDEPTGHRLLMNKYGAPVATKQCDCACCDDPYDTCRACGRDMSNDDEAVCMSCMPPNRALGGEDRCGVCGVLGGVGCVCLDAERASKARATTRAFKRYVARIRKVTHRANYYDEDTPSAVADAKPYTFRRGVQVYCQGEED
jgi:hypothetical protein